MLKRLWVILGFVVAIGATSVRAEEGKWELGLSGGPGIPSGDFGDVFDSGGYFRGSLFYGLDSIISFGPRLGYLFGAQAKTAYVAPPAEVDASVFHFTPTIKVGPMLNAGSLKLNPYVAGGGGWYRTHYTASVPGFSTSTTENNGGFNLGGGLNLFLTPNVAVGFDFRYHHILYKNATDVEFVVPAAQISFLLSE